MKVLIFLSIPFILFSCAYNQSREEGTVSPELRINQIQVIGSHNSYKEAIEPALFQLMKEQEGRNFEGLEYEHIALSKQLDLGLRKLELDILHDPLGGRYAEPIGLELVRQAGKEPLPFDSLGVLETPGLKIMHNQNIDFRSNCLRLTDCLREIKNWSDAHKAHIPIVISFNLKMGGSNLPGFVKALPFTPQAFDTLDQEILSVFERERIIGPDDVRGEFETLEEAVKANNWPLLSESRGKVLFVLNSKNKKMQENYKRGASSLKDRLVFIEAEPGQDEAAFLFLNNPINQQDSIQKMVKMGYLVRTRADSGTKEARKGDYSRFEAALSSGAQFISTDYYIPNEAFGTDYKVQFPKNEIAICNPVNAKELQDCKIEE